MEKGKRCGRCKTEKDCSEFAPNKKSLSGLKSYCRDCEKEYLKEYARANPEKLAAKRREYYENNKDVLLKKQKEYWKKNIVDCRRRKIERRNNNLQVERARAREWKRANKEKVAEINRKRRVKKKKASIGSDLTAEKWSAILASWDGKCASCGSRKDVGMDHIIALHIGGSHTSDNVQPLCRSCNSSKQTKAYSFLRPVFYPNGSYCELR